MNIDNSMDDLPEEELKDYHKLIGLNKPRKTKILKIIRSFEIQDLELENNIDRNSIEIEV